ncbi:MAG: hypothetical protein FJ295_10975 [Planctomycetes bacterium]|nr:hypothetical protein [Planctomycetota bacterium]
MNSNPRNFLANLTYASFYTAIVIGSTFATSMLSHAHTTRVQAEGAGRYLVLSLVDSKSEFFPAAQLLANRHAAEIVVVEPSSLETVREKLKAVSPEFVAFVVHPAQLDYNLVNRMFALSTQVDSDPFVDFFWGVITGRDGAAAEKLVRASESARPQSTPTIGLLGVGGSAIKSSQTMTAAWPLRTGQVPVTNFLLKGKTDLDRDEKFITETMPKLKEFPIILLASHGYPDGLVAGPKASDLKNIDLSGAVMLNIACYTGVTCDWFEDDFQSMTVRKRTVASKDSFCLQAIDSGVAAYIAYVSPRPAGPTMMGEALKVAASGQPLGSLFRESLQDVVMAHLLSGDHCAQSYRLEHETALEQQRTPASVVKRFSTGGVLFGDPAFRPFPAKADSDTRRMNLQAQEDHVTVDIKLQSPVFHFFAGDQLNYWDDQHSALRMECVVPLHDQFVEGVEVLEVPAGIEHYRWVAAIEHDSGQRQMRWKLNFAQPTDNNGLFRLAAEGLQAKIKISTTSRNENTEQPIYRGSLLK